MNANRTPALAFIFVTLLIDIMGFGLTIPVLPRLVQELTHTTISGSSTTLGWLQASFGLMQFAFAPFLGNLSDRYGRRPVLLLSLAFTAVEYAILGTVGSVAWLFVGRILTGATSASFTAASAYIADISAPEERAKNFGLIGAAFGLGFILGPALGGLVGALNVRAPFWMAAALTGANLLFGFFVLPESLAPENRRPVDLRKANPFGSFRLFGRVPWVLTIVFALGFMNLAGQMLQNTWVIANELRFGWSELQNGLTLALLGGATIVVQMGVLRAMLPRYGEAKTLVFGLAFQLVGFIGFAFAGVAWVLIGFMLLWSLSFVSGPALQGLVSKEYGADEQGAVQGGLSALQSLTGVVSPLVATGVFRAFTAKGAAVHFPGAPYLLGAIFSAVAVGLVYLALMRRRSEPQAAIA